MYLAIRIYILVYILVLNFSFEDILVVVKVGCKVTFAPNLAKTLSSIFYYLILLFQLSQGGLNRSVANP